MCRGARRGFTMVELVFVIVIVGIIGGLAMRKSSDTSLIEARNQVISHLRYAQHLAMGDEKFVGNREMAPGAHAKAETEFWKNRWWRVQFHTINNAQEGKVGETYSVYSEAPTSAGKYNGNPAGNSIIARDPLSGLCLSYYTKNNLPDKCKTNRDGNLRLEKRFGISGKVSVKTKECSAGQRKIFFDGMGAPYCGGDDPKKLTEAAEITLTKGGKSEKICIEAVTGYIHGC